MEKLKPLHNAVLAIPIAIACVFWFIMFSPWTKDSINFWYTMLVAATLLLGLVFLLDQRRIFVAFSFKLMYIWVGIVAAAVLYSIFFVGNWVGTMLFDFVKPQVFHIYATKTQMDETFIFISLIFWIGPVEEIFWRGFIQKHLSIRYNGWVGFLITLGLYTLVHIWSFNLVLLVAATLCGIFWGLMFWYYRSIWPGLISHALWDAVIFVVAPIS